MNSTHIIIIVIWFFLLYAKFLKFNKIEDYTTILRLEKFSLHSLKTFYQVKLINISTLLFYIAFGFTELDFKYFILHILIFIVSTIKIKTNKSKNINNIIKNRNKVI